MKETSRNGVLTLNHSPFVSGSSKFVDRYFGDDCELCLGASTTLQNCEPSRLHKHRASLKTRQNPTSMSAGETCSLHRLFTQYSQNKTTATLEWKLRPALR